MRVLNPTAKGAFWFLRAMVHASSHLSSVVRACVCKVLQDQGSLSDFAALLASVIELMGMSSR